jgi:GNAT superfamily N-acetyltransferase
VLAGAGMAAYARDTMNGAAATSRMATNIGVATDELSTFGRMLERNGGNAESAMASMKGFTDQVSRLKYLGQGSQELMTFMGTINAPIGSNALQTYMKFVEWAERHRNDPQLVNTIGQMGGLDQSAINEALKGIAQVRKDWENAKVGALTPEQAEAMQRMQEAWKSLDQSISMVGRDLVVDVEPAFTAVAKGVSGWVEGNRKLADTLGGVLTAITAFTALRPAAWVLRLLGLEGMAAAAGPVGVAGALAYANLPTTANSGEKNIYENGKLTHYGKSLIAKDQAATGGAAAGGGSGAFGSQAEKEAYIRQMAAQIGMDPDTAMRVARSEGFKDFSGDSGTSFGAFQLHVTPNGRGHAVGDQFRHDTGLDPSDPANERQVIDYALQWARKHGWGDFHGAARTGIGQWQGVGSTTDVQIGSVTINTRATDAAGIARDLHSEIKRRFNSPSSLATQANTGLTP